MEYFRKLSNQDNELYRRADEVLHYLWDPIGVAECPGARDEYHSYLPQVFSLLKRDAGANEIADYLGKVTLESMELGRDRDRDLEIAEILLNWKDEIIS